MEDIFKDKEFDGWLCGGVHDLDEDIGNLVYEIYKKRVVETVTSCSGHIGERIVQDGGTSLRPLTHWVYKPGRLYFSNNDGGDLDGFAKKMREYSKGFKFVGFEYPSSDGVHKIILEMKDLKCPILNYSATYGEVKIEDAKKRYSEFRNFWEGMREIVREFG